MFNINLFLVSHTRPTMCVTWTTNEAASFGPYMGGLSTDVDHSQPNFEVQDVLKKLKTLNVNASLIEDVGFFAVQDFTEKLENLSAVDNK